MCNQAGGRLHSITLTSLTSLRTPGIYDSVGKEMEQGRGQSSRTAAPCRACGCGVASPWLPHAWPPLSPLPRCSLCRPWTRPSTTGRRSHDTNGRLRPHPCATAAREHGRSPQHHWPPRPFGRAARTHGTPETARTCPSRPSLAPTAMRRVHRAPAARL